MATLTHPDDTGTLDRAAVEDAASRAEAERTGELRAWLDAHGAVSGNEPVRDRAAADAASAAHLDASSPAGVPPILVHQHVWPATPEAFHPTAPAGSADLDALVDRALAPVGSSGDTSVPDPARSTAPGALASPDRPDEVQIARRRLGWATMIAVWAVATAITVPLAISSIVGAFDMTIDLGGSGEVVAEEAPADVDGSDEQDTDTELAGR